MAVIQFFTMGRQLNLQLVSGRMSKQDDQDGTRFWREEREEGAVYNTYLKRVTYLSPARVCI